jgi:hypothetical protein
VGVAALIFDPIAAMTAIKSWAEETLDGLYVADEIRRGRRTAPENSQRQVTITPLRPYPTSDGWTDGVWTLPQRNVVVVDVTAAAPGVYSVPTAFGVASYTALIGDTAPEIRNALRVALDALAGPFATADNGASGVEVTGDTAGQWLGIQVVTAPAGGGLAVYVLDDVIVRVSGQSARWEVSISITDTRDAGGVSKATEAAQRFYHYLQAGNVPLVNGLAYYSSDVLKAANLAYLSASPPVVADFVEPSSAAIKGTTWKERAIVDVVFQTTTGTVIDLPSIESFGSPAVIVTE